MKKTMITLAALLVLTASLYAQNKMEFPEYAIKNLKAGVCSENPGLKKHSIFLAGKYEVEEAAGTLEKELSKEADPSVRSLIALSLYKIEGAKVKKLAYRYAANDPDEKVRNIFASICKLCDAESASSKPYAVR